MAIQLLLTLFFVVVLVASIPLGRGSRLLASGVFAGTLGALLLVWFPDLATALAHQVGVGRGTDLLLYAWFVISGLLLLGAYLRVRRLSEEFTQLVRAIALSQASGAGSCSRTVQRDSD